MLRGKGYQDRNLSESEVREVLSSALSSARLDGKRVLVIIPDSTRTAPIPLMFRLFHEYLGTTVSALDYLIALGTHQPLGETAILRLAGISRKERDGKYGRVKIVNHRWDLPDTFVSLGQITAEEIEEITSGLMCQAVDVRLNRMVFDCIRVTLATRVPRARGERLNVGYMSPADLDEEEWKNREQEGILLVPKAGEMLYRVKGN
jgi:nickel-dependent lactate racemase